MARRTSDSTGGGRRSTIREVADRAGVSVATVSRILKRVLRAVEELDYVANAHARALAGTSAVFALNDLIAGGACRALTEHGIRVPEDVSMVGFDDLQPSLGLNLTSVHLPHAEIGRTAVRLALEHEARGGPPPHVVLGTHLVVRDSVRPHLS